MSLFKYIDCPHKRGIPTLGTPTGSSTEQLPTRELDTVILCIFKTWTVFIQGNTNMSFMFMCMNNIEGTLSLIWKPVMLFFTLFS